MSKTNSKSKSKAAMESLGTFEESEAHAIAGMLNAKELIHAVVAQLFVGVHGDQPTVWWHVNVPSRSMASATAWLRGYQGGKVYSRAAHHRLGKGMLFADAVRALGYAEYLPQDGVE